MELTEHDLHELAEDIIGAYGRAEDPATINPKQWDLHVAGVERLIRTALVASPQAGAQREGGQVTPKMMSEVFAASVTNTDPEHEHLYDHRIAAELLNKMLASPPSGEPGRLTNQQAQQTGAQPSETIACQKCGVKGQNLSCDGHIWYPARASVESGERLREARITPQLLEPILWDYGYDDMEGRWEEMVRVMETDALWANGKHCGDCTKQAHTCQRCLVESVKKDAVKFAEKLVRALAERGKGAK